MKDYRLSEIKEICKTTIGGCNNCGVQNECHLLSAQQPHGWDIEPRDMIELPCKMEYEGKYGKCWKVYYRNVLDGTIDHKGFYDETQADDFLQELKNGKV